MTECNVGQVIKQHIQADRGLPTYLGDAEPASMPAERRVQCLLCSFLGCSRKVLQPGWLKTTNIYYLTVLEAVGLKSRCGQGHAPSEGSREESCLASCCFW